ncbi:hypothetical protein CcaverHIS002_0502100 [Cutaneotrichosporon cavernicola]|uniref:Uncharacterized protein n=1 Tax=Cutaneotrichosporon cavernicola TaxID=279322 RepID=A0AA48QWR5_9TREE|nr:uncharacterized protein CcaverHIS019_0502680 [Cutaneotrichosporon cavernicola]BEI84809.1 hypothetical protein CcaverHIS002_0502100 [Cutaneotrichosporon cavernicola]BEI92640.1 hypothetical protein CcaverHIS019_0502680 [Cutaneotrichosporon cavernicola]BEJ00415.1 hypothetical protein CcaverHIS631_0502720 [Cutaneotrichosporon cavernicola]BEJ08185.1 hypothetical protein CcaverHIS641_0502700 [Cutaneotrichosporon cavernicola]
MLMHRAQAAVKAFSKKNEQPQLDEKAGMPISSASPVAEIPLPEDGVNAEPAEADEKPKFTIRALFAPKKKPTEAPAEAEAVQAVQAPDPFAAQNQEVVIDQSLMKPEAVEVATEEGEKKKGLARIFSLKRKRAVDSAGPSTTEAEPKAEVDPTTEEATPAEATEAPALEGPTEAESKRASWKRLRLSRAPSNTPKDDAEATLTRTQSPIIETTADILASVNAEPAEEKKENKFWVFGRKDEVSEPETVSPAEAAADAPAAAQDTEAKETPAPPKPTVWKRFMSISKIPEPEPKKDDKPEDAAETPATATESDPAPAPATATDTDTDAAPASEDSAEAPAPPETPVTEKKGFFVSFGRKASKVEAVDTPAEATEAKVDEAEPTPAPAAESEASDKRSSIYRIFSGFRKPVTEVATEEPTTEEPAEAPVAVTEESQVEELKEATPAPAAETSEAGSKGLYRIFSGRRKASKAEPSVASAQAETVAAETTEETKEECNCPAPKEEPAAESSRAGLFRLFSSRKASADANAENPKEEAEAPSADEPAAEATAEVSNEEVKEAPKEETPKVWKRLLSVHKKPTPSPDAEVRVADAESPPVAEATAAPNEEPKEEKANFVTRLRSLVPTKEKEAAVEAAVAETTEEPVEKVEKPGVIARVASALSLTRVKATTPADTVPAAEDAKSAEAAPVEAAKPAEEPVAAAAEPAAPVTAEASAPADAPKA